MNYWGVLFILLTIVVLMVNFLPVWMLDLSAQKAREKDPRRPDWMDEEEDEEEQRRTSSFFYNWTFYDQFWEWQPKIILASLAVLFPVGIAAGRDGFFHQQGSWIFFLFLLFELGLLGLYATSMMKVKRTSDFIAIEARMGGFSGFVVRGCASCLFLPISFLLSFIAAAAVVGWTGRLIAAL